MRAVMVMYDTLSRRYLENYGCDWVKTPNFKRLEEKCCRFDKFYVGSMPCMPARRELHTGKYNYMHRAWGPLEPFDFSCIDELNKNGIYTHLVTDHSHYFEDGGATYHNRYTSWEAFRGQEGDRWTPQDYGTIPSNRNQKFSKKSISVQQHYANLTRMPNEEDMPSVKTFQTGIDFIEKHANKDNWFLQIESFDPHEPFYVPQKYRDRVGLKGDQVLHWPAYMPVDEQKDIHELTEIRKEYVALIMMCDEYLGKVLDTFDRLNLWEDTMLIVNTDHGFLLGEHDMMGKNFGPQYEEITHIPFFIYDPDTKAKGVRNALCQTIDICPTILDYFKCNIPDNLDGHSLRQTVVDDTPVRKVAGYGVHTSYSCVTDGKMTYYRAQVGEKNEPTVQCTLMPTNMRGFFKTEEINQAKLMPGNRFTNGVAYLKIPFKTYYDTKVTGGDLLFDLSKDPHQSYNLVNEVDTSLYQQWLKELLIQVEAPEEEFIRLGLTD